PHPCLCCSRDPSLATARPSGCPLGPHRPRFRRCHGCPSTGKRARGTKRAKAPPGSHNLPPAGLPSLPRPRHRLRPRPSQLFPPPALGCSTHGPQSVRPGGCRPPASRRSIRPACRLRYHPWWPGPLLLTDQEAWRPLPPGARFAPHRDLCAGVGEGGGARGHRGGLQNVRQGGLLPCLGGRRSGGGGEGPSGGGVYVPLEPLEDLGVRLVLTSVPPFLPDAALLPALSALGKPISVINPLSLGC
ncbi:hypothetical protein G0U57_000252, partial [Chelydra serpentina]